MNHQWVYEIDNTHCAVCGLAAYFSQSLFTTAYKLKNGTVTEYMSCHEVQIKGLLE